MNFKLGEFNWPLVAGLGIVAVIVLYILFKAGGILSGAGQLGSSIGSVGQGVGNLVNTVTGAATGAVTTAESYVAPTVPAAGQPPSSGSLFWSGLDNFFSTGSIYSSQ
jgi:hypothetical protein